jgi:hypothetical protein
MENRGGGGEYNPMVLHLSLQPSHLTFLPLSSGLSAVSYFLLIPSDLALLAPASLLTFVLSQYSSLDISVRSPNMKFAALCYVATVLHALPGFGLPTPAAQTLDDGEAQPQPTSNDGGPISRFGQPLFNIGTTVSTAYLWLQNRRLKNRLNTHIGDEDLRFAEHKRELAKQYIAIAGENRQLLDFLRATRIIRVAGDNLPEPLKNHPQMKACLLTKLGHGQEVGTPVLVSPFSLICFPPPHRWPPFSECALLLFLSRCNHSFKTPLP